MRFVKLLVGVAAAAATVLPALADVDVFLLDVPDYNWYFGCAGTASGNLAGFWDRHGFPDFYTGPTSGGEAPLDTAGSHSSIRALWASQAGLDGRPPGQPGHVDDYYLEYQSTAPDPYVTAGRTEHSPDCLGDFIGQSQNRWKNMNGECDGNIDAYTFVFWDSTGERRWNFVPGTEGTPVRDIPSGLRSWTRWRGYDCDVFSQLADFNPKVPAGKGFTYADLKAEIDAGYPVFLFLQSYSQTNRSLGNMPRANPEIHSMLAYGYVSYPDLGIYNGVRYRTSWASGQGLNTVSEWNANIWQAGMPLRGLIGYHPKPKIRTVARASGATMISWDGPAAQRYDAIAGTSTDVHYYVVEQSDSVTGAFLPVTQPSTNRSVTLPDCNCSVNAFFRVRLVTAP